ncbi:hypothetical protein D3C74_333780 [compost metagenome]
MKGSNQLLAFNIQVWQNAIQPFRKSPSFVSENSHDGWNQSHADDESIDQNAYGQGETNLLDHDIIGEDKSCKYRDHDHCCGNNHATDLIVPMNDGFGSAMTVDI